MVAVTSLFSKTDNNNVSGEMPVAVERKSIVSLQDQINNIQSEVTEINSGLNSIGSLIEKDSLLEQSRLLEEQKREQLNSQRNLRIGAENELEKKINDTLSKSVSSLEPKLNSVFNSITRSIGSLFGFLSLGTIPLISKISGFAIKGLRNAKDFVFKSLRFVFSTLSSLKNGFSNVTKSIGNIISKISGIAFKFAKSPIKSIANLFKKIPGFGGGGLGSSPTPSNFGKNIFGKILKFSGAGLLSTGIDILSGEEPKRAAAGGLGMAFSAKLGAKLGSIFGPVGSVVGGVGLGILGSGVGKGIYDSITNNFNPTEFTDTSKKLDNDIFDSTNTSSSSYVFNDSDSTPVTTSNFDSDLTNTKNPNLNFKTNVTPTENTVRNYNTTNVTPTENTVRNYNTTNVTPTENTVRNYNNSQKNQLNTFNAFNIKNFNTPKILSQENQINSSYQQNIENKNNLIENMSNIFNTNINGFDKNIRSANQSLDTNYFLKNKENEVDFQSQARIDSSNNLDKKNTYLEIPEVKISPLSKQNNTVTSISSFPEQKPEIIVASTLPQSENQKRKPRLPQSSPLTDINLIPSSNIDNFYTLYSQLNYNVVI